MKKFILLAIIGIAVVGCGAPSSPGPAPKVYISKNNVEVNNINRRQQLADDPTTILWCTIFTFDSKPTTVPIVGKLTSGPKRLTPGTVTDTNSNDGWYNPERPGPDHTYGASSDYRYGFGPAGQYSDFYNIPTYCTTLPTVYQANTTISLQANGKLAKATAQARAVLAQGGPNAGNHAEQILVNAASGH